MKKLMALLVVLSSVGAWATDVDVAKSSGEKTERVKTEEVNGPAVGEDWTSPATGMEFVWIPKLKCWVGKYEVTNGEYRKKDSNHDSKEYKGHGLNGDRQPVVYVNYADAQAYAKWLTQQDRDVLGGAEYRLPTSNEFTAFAQCDDGRKYPWGDNWPPKSGQAGNYSGQESTWRNKIGGYRDGHPVTCDVEKSWKNPWGLYGVGGNVWECTSKSPGGDFDAWRGASWGGIETRVSLRCSYRGATYASYRGDIGGFRVLLFR